MKKRVRMFVVLAVCIVFLGVWTVLHGQANGQNGSSGATYLVTITDANTGAFASRSVITLHADHSVAVIDSGQGGPAFQFSSQQGVWEHTSGGGAVARTLDFSFPSAGIARVDYNFTTLNNDQVSGTITLTIFPLTGNPLDGGGTVAGTFNFTGTRVTTP